MGGTDDEDRTVFLPGGSAPSAPSWPTPSQPASAPPPPSPASTPPPSAAPGSTAFSAAPRREGSGIQEGDVLNHIFEVRRFIARGGMGEVFEGVNINSEERVAIKVMLPALAADPNIQAMFRKEARTLTRLSNPALVQYRVLAQEPQLGVLYIVTEFIDGQNLCDLLGQLHPTGPELVALTRRLAAGLEVAHGLGAIHRDMSPDNVLLEDGRLDRAKVIDFGIAKDLDPGAKTVVGDGFAGKLGYVAPEQLGDYDRQVGPWTDVYSLGLVILAVATGRNPDLSGSFVEAIDKRRRGIDVSAVPAELRAVLGRMLAADPAQRFRSMGEVLDALAAPSPADDAAARTMIAPAAPAASPAAAPRPSRAKEATDSAGGGNKGLLIGGGVGGAVLLLAGIGYLAFGGGSSRHAAAPNAPVAASAPASASVATAVSRALPTIGCSWLDLAGVTPGADGSVVRLTGAAGDPAAAQAAVARAVAASGATLASSDFSEVAPIDRDMCPSIDAFRAVQATGPALLSVAQRKFEMSTLPADSDHKGENGARAVLNLDIGNPSQEFAFYGIEPDGKVEAVLPNRKTLTDLLKISGGRGSITDLGGDRYRFQVDVTHTGWSGALLVTANSGLPDTLIATATGKRAPGWAEQFARAAAAGGWKTHMVWFKTVDEVPN